MTVIRKTFTDTNSKGMEFVLSDATPDRYGDIINQDGWDLTHFKNNPIALFNHNPDFVVGKWINVRVVDGQLRGYLQLAPKGASSRIDEIHHLVDAGILRTTSVGFLPKEHQPIGKGHGSRYLKSELVETSLVSIPANPNALAVAKSLNISPETLAAVFAEQGKEDPQLVRRGLPPASKPNLNESSKSSKDKTMSGLSARIESMQAKIVTTRDELDAHLASLGEEPDEATTATTVELTTKLGKLEDSHEALKRAEVQLSKAAGGVRLPAVSSTARENDDANAEARLARASSKVFASAAKKVTPFDFLIKAITADIKHFGEGRKRGILEVVQEIYGTQLEMGEQVRRTMSLMVTKAAAIPADTTTSHWASELVQTVTGDFIQSLMPYSVYPALAAKGGSFTFGRNGVISLPARTVSTAVAGAFVAQGAAIPVKQGAFEAITLTPKKMGVITTMTREIMEHSIPAIEAILRQAMLEDTAVAIDTALLDATAASTTRPAGLKNGIAKINASAATANLDKFIADVSALVGALITATSGNIRSPAWIMNPGDVLKASLLQTTTGETPFREELAGGTLLTYPVIQTTTGLSDMMGLIDAADFITATGDTPNFSVSDQAVLHMEDSSPAALSAAATPNTVAAPIRSLWQTDTLAIRMLLDMNWAKRRTGIFQWTDTMGWN